MANNVVRAIGGIIAVFGMAIGIYGLFPVLFALSALPTLVGVLSTGAGTASILTLTKDANRPISRVLLLSSLILVFAVIIGLFVVTADLEFSLFWAQTAVVLAVAYLAVSTGLALFLDRRRKKAAAEG